jgi:hypothetical protein
MKPPAPVTTTRSFFDIDRPFQGERAFIRLFKDLRGGAGEPRERPSGHPAGCRAVRLLVRCFAVKSLYDTEPLRKVASKSVARCEKPFITAPSRPDIACIVLIKPGK